MWRFFLIGLLAVFVCLTTFVHQAEAGFGGCFLGARDNEDDILGFNYFWVAFAECSLGEDFDKAHISVELQQYDWNAERWQVIQCCGGATEYNDSFAVAFGAVAVPIAPPPFIGMNCR